MCSLLDWHTTVFLSFFRFTISKSRCVRLHRRGRGYSSAPRRCQQPFYNYFMGWVFGGFQAKEKAAAESIRINRILPRNRQSSTNQSLEIPVFLQAVRFSALPDILLVSNWNWRLCFHRFFSTWVIIEVDARHLSPKPGVFTVTFCPDFDLLTRHSDNLFKAFPGLLSVAPGPN